MSTTRGVTPAAALENITEEEGDSPILRRESRRLAERNARTDPPAAIVLVDPDLQALCLNGDAIRLLSFSGGLAAARAGWQAVRTQVLSDSPHDLSHASAGFRNFVSGGRCYRCRVFPLEVRRSRHGSPAAVVVIERDRPAWFPTAEALAVFHLTAREEQAVRFALSSLTNKQIGAEMGISPNTVKALLRMAMTKIGVSSRMGIVHKLSCARDARGEADAEFAVPAIEPPSAARAAKRAARQNSSHPAARPNGTPAEFWLADRRRTAPLAPHGST